MTSLVRRPARWSAVWASLPLTWALPALAQFAAPPAAPVNPRADAPEDLTGYWVSLVTEDWRVRMMTPDKGDATGVPLNAAGRAVLANWDPAKDEASGQQCKSYGAPALMRIPTRLHITWDGDTVLHIETDAGKQTRLLHFGAQAPQGAAPSLQGFSAASWDGGRPGGARGVTAGVAGKATTEGYLRVVTTQLQPGYLRKNGIPYGANARLEEYFESFKEPNGDSWLVVTSVVTDPDYLNGNFINSSQFKKLSGPSGWNPRSCEAK